MFVRKETIQGERDRKVFNDPSLEGPATATFARGVVVFLRAPLGWIPQSSILEFLVVTIGY